MGDVRAAEDRLRRYRSLTKCGVGEWLDADGTAYDRWSRAELCEALADDALAEADPTPVTAEGLRGAGFWGRGRTELVTPPARYNRDAGNRRPWRLIYDADPPPGCGKWSVSFPGCEAGLGCDLPTMGDVVRTCRALGIELKEAR
jgi:hypothetical protein